MTVRRPLFSPIGHVAPGGINLPALATLIRTTAGREGCIQVSMDEDLNVYATPERHPFSVAMLRQHADCIVGTYNYTSHIDAIREDLAATMAEHQASA